MRARQEADATDSYAEAVRAGRKPQLNWQFLNSCRHSREQPVRGCSAGMSVNVLGSMGAPEAALTVADSRAQSVRTVMGQTLLDRQTAFQQWAQLGRHSLFTVMSAETDHFSQRVAYVNALMDSAQANASLRSAGESLMSWAHP